MCLCVRKKSKTHARVDRLFGRKNIPVKIPVLHSSDTNDVDRSRSTFYVDNLYPDNK